MSEIIDIKKLDLSQLDIAIPGDKPPENAAVPAPESIPLHETANVTVGDSGQVVVTPLILTETDLQSPVPEAPPTPPSPPPVEVGATTHIPVSEISITPFKPTGETPPKPVKEKVVKGTKWIFWAVAGIFALLILAQLVFNVPHPKSWHFGLLGPSRGNTDVVFVPEHTKNRPKVIETGRFLIAIQFPDGHIEKRTGGSHSWRLNNPGRLSYNKFTIAQGAFGSDKKYAIFENYQQGRKANEVMLFDDPAHGYRNMTIKDAIKKYSEGDSDASEYARLVSKEMKLPTHIKLGSFNADQKKKFLDQIELIEQFVPGRVWKYKDLEEYKRLG